MKLLKRGDNQQVRSFLTRGLLGMGVFLCTSSLFANPVLDNVAAGNVSIQQTTNTTTVNQASQRAIINWQSFNIGAQESTHFQQPAGGVALNRINPTQGPSSVYGRLTATGQIILVNPAGIFFGPSAYVNVGGLIASTADIADADFLNGDYRFNKLSPYAGSIINQGQIIAENHGLIALLANGVRNDGLIQANLGQVILASGQAFTLTFSGNDLISFTIDKEATEGITNTGTISANGGAIMITAKATQGVLDQAINLSGMLEARSVFEKNGEIIISGDDAGIIALQGDIDATGMMIGELGGTVTMTGKEIHLASMASINVSGYAGGGDILIGGNAHGAGPLPHADTVVLTSGASLKADATGHGNGGNVVLWSNQATWAHGSISAKGGPLGGNGGFIETSGHYLNVAGIQINTSAPHGQTGLWLLDPTDVTISTAADSNASFNNPLYQPTNGALATTNINTINLETQLATTNVTVTTTPAAGFGGAGLGNITVVDPITWTSTNALTLQAVNNIIINAAISGINGSLVLTAVNNAQSITTGAGGTIDVNNFSITQGQWYQVGTLPAFNVRNNFYLPPLVDNGIAPLVDFLRASGGTGSNASPYLIADVYGLQGIGSSLARMDETLYYALANNIDASSTKHWDNGQGYGFAPIGITPSNTGNNAYRFRANFDGQGYVIDHLYINRAQASNVGLFGVVFSSVGPTPQIKNVGIINADITGGTNVGAIAGFQYSGGTEYSNVYSSGTISGSQYVGGLIGFGYGTISSSYSNANVFGNSQVGGLQGSVRNNINNSYSLGNVTGTSYVGGIAGELDSSGSIVNTYSTGAVVGYSNVGGLLGSLNSGTVTNSFWDIETSGRATSSGSSGTAGYMGMTTAQMTTLSNFQTGSPFISSTGWNIGTDHTSNIWVSFTGNTRPLLASEYSTTINNAHQLQLIGLNSTTLGATYVLGTNVDASGTSRTTDIWATSTTNNGVGFIPIGISPTFSGSLNGQHYAISDLYINATPQYTGLFGISNGVIQNLGFINAVVKGSSNGWIGVLAGRSNNSVTNVYSINGTVTSTGSVVGGLVGGNFAALSDVFTTGTVSSPTGSYVGGIVGTAHGDIDRAWGGSHVTGSVDVGGVAGDGGSAILDSYATGNVTGNFEVGGLIGFMQNSATITSSYSSGVVTGNSFAGGLVGNNENGAYTNVFNSFWDTETSGKSFSAGGTGQTTTQMTDPTTFWAAGWSLGSNISSDTWVAIMGDANSRPILASEYSQTIRTPHQLQLVIFDTSVPYTLGNDLDLSTTYNVADVWATSLSNGGLGFVPINNLTTTFDGQYHTIDNLYINNDSPNFAAVGLFSLINIGGSIIDLYITNANITNAHNNSPHAGIVVGENVDGLIKNVHTSGSVTATGTGAYAGGMIGVNLNFLGLARLIDSSNTANISVTGGSGSPSYAGGLVGWNDINAIITTSYNSGNVTANPGSASSLHAGGLVGYQVGSIANSYNIGNVNLTGLAANANYAAGGLVGLIDATSGAITNTYSSGLVTTTTALAGGFAGVNNAAAAIASGGFFDTDTSGQASAVGSGTLSGVTGNVFGSSSGELAAFNTYNSAGWNISATVSTSNAPPSATWFIFDGKTRPMLMAEYSTNPVNAHQVQLMGSTLNARYTLSGDIDFANGMNNKADIWGTNASLSVGNGFVPIGDTNAQFTGVLNGNGHVINHLYINRPTEEYIGLFGYTYTSEISNVEIANANITGRNYVAALAGNATTTAIDRVSIKDLTLTAGDSGSGFSMSGGLAGLAWYATSITHSYTTGNLTGLNMMGGITASLFHSLIDQTWSSARVYGGTYSGGIAGTAQGDTTISNTYFSGAMLNPSAQVIGGIVGEFSTGATIFNTYSTGYIAGSFININGLVGRSEGTILNSFWDIAASGQSNGVEQIGGTVTNLTGGTLDGSVGANLSSQTTFTNAPYNWDFTSIWNIVPGQSYPYLRSSFTGTPRVISGTSSLAGGTSLTLASNGTAIMSAPVGANGFIYLLGDTSYLADDGIALLYQPGSNSVGNLLFTLPSNGASVSGLVFADNNTVSISQTNGTTSLSNSRIAAAISGYSGTGFWLSAAGSDLTVSANKNFNTTATTNYLLDGNITTSGTGTLSLNGPVTLANNFNLTTSQDIALGAMNGAFDLAINATGGTVTFNSAIGGITPLSSLSVTADSILIGANITVDGNTIDFNSPVTLVADAVVSDSGDINYHSTVDGAYNLTVNSSGGNVTFSGIVGGIDPLASLTVTGSTIVVDGGAVYTINNQLYNNAVTLGADALFESSAGDITYVSSVNSAVSFRDLTINSLGTTTFGGSIGDIFPILNLTTDGGILLMNGGTVITRDSQTYNDAIMLGANTDIFSQSGGGSVTFNNTIDGAFELHFNNSVIYALNDVVGGLTPLDSLHVDDSGIIVLIGANAITTTGTQNYNNFGNAIILTASTTLTGDGIILNTPLFGGGSNLTIVDTGNTQINNDISGVGQLDITSGTGTTLNTNDIGSSGSQTYQSNITLGTNVILTSSSDDIMINGDVTGAGNAFTIHNAGASSAVNGVMSDLSSFTKNGTGTLTLNNANTYTTTTTISSGTLVAASDNALGDNSATVVVDNGGILALQGFLSPIVNNMTFNNGSTLAVTNVFGVNELSGTIGLNGTVSVAVNGLSESLTLSGILSGTSVALVKDGIGQLILTGSNTYSGDTFVNGGTLVLGSNDAMGTSTATIAGTAALQLAGTSLSIANDLVFNDGSSLIENNDNADNHLTGDISLNGTVSFNVNSTNNDNLTLSGTGVLSGSGIILNKSGAGRLIIAGTNPNTLTGTINILNGTIELQKTNALGSLSTNTITIGNSNTLVINGTPTATDITTPNNIILNGTGVSLAGALVDISTGRNNTLSGSITLGQDSSSIGVTNLGNTLTISGAIDDGSNSYDWAKVGGGTLILAGINTFGDATNGLTINNGQVTATNNSSLGNAAAPVSVISGAILAINAIASTIQNPITLNGVGTGAGALVNISGMNTLSGNIALGSHSTVGVTTSGDNLTLSGVVSGGFNLSKAGNGTLTLSNSNTFTGSVFVNDGILSLTHNEAVGNAGTHAADVTVANGASLHLAGVNITPVIDLTLEGTGDGSAPGALYSNAASVWNGDINLVTASTTTLLSTSGVLTINGSINGAADLTLNGGGGMALNGTVGDTTKPTSLQSNTPLTIGTTTIDTNGTQTYNGAVELAANAIFTANNNTISFNSTIDRDTTARSLTIGSSGNTAAITLAGNVGAGVNGALGAITLNSSNTTTFLGTINAASLTTDTGTGGSVQMNGGSITTSGDQAYGENITLGQNTILTSTTGNINAVGNISGAFDLTIDNAGTTSAVTGIISSITALNKSGSGTLTLGANTYTSTTNINLGTVVATTNTSFGTAAATITVVGTNAAMALNGTSLNIPNAISLSGSGVSSSGALLDMSTATSNTVSGNITLTGNTSVGVTNSGTTLILSGIINDGVNDYNFTKVGNGVTVLSNANTFTGATFINAGTLRLTNTNALGNAVTHTSDVTVADGASLHIASVSLTPTLPLTLNGTGVGSNGALQGTGTASWAGAIELDSNSTIAAPTITDVLTLNSAIDNNFVLTLAGAGTIHLAGIVGGTTPLAALISNAGTTGINTASITTVGTQTYNNNVLLNPTGALVTLTTTDSDVTIAGTLESVTPKSLTIAAGTGAVNLGAIAQSNSLGALSSTGSGTVTLNGSLGTGLGAKELSSISLAGNAVFNASLSGIFTSGNQSYAGVTLNTSPSIASSSGTIDFNGAVSGAAQTITLQSTTSTGAVTFNNNVNLTDIVTAAGNYNIALLGATTAMTNSMDFLNTGTVTLGNGSDTLTFVGGLATNTGPTTTLINGNVLTNGNAISLGATTLNGASSLATNNTVATGAALSLDAITSGGNALSLNAGTSGTITGSSFAGGGDLTITHSGGTSFSGVINAGTVALTNTTGTIAFNDNVTATAFTTTANNYHLSLLGSTTSITNATSLLNIGTNTLGNGSDTLTFIGGLTATAGNTHLNGTVRTNGNTLSLGATTLNGTSSLATNNTVATGAALSLGAITSNANALTLNAGTSGTITGTSFAGNGDLTITHSGGTSFSSTINAGTITLTNTTGTIAFSDNVTATALTTAANNYHLSLLGSTTSITNATTLLNTGTNTLGNGSDILTFIGGLTATAGSATINGTVLTNGNALSLGATALNGTSSLATNNTVATGAALSLGAVTSGGNALTLDAGTSGTITGTSFAGGGDLTMVDSNGATFSSNVNANTVTLTDTTSTITFNGLTATTLTTANQSYDLTINGTATITNAVNFLNTGVVTLGNGGTQTYTGGIATTGNASNPTSTTLSGTINTTNTAMTLGSTTLSGNTALNPGSGTLTISTGLNGGGNTLAITNTDNSSAISALMTNVSTFTKLGSGTLTISGNNVGFAGTVDLNAGVLQVGSATNALGSGALNFNGGNLQANLTAALTNPFTLNSNASLIGTNALTLSGTGTLNGGTTLSVTNTNTTTLSGNLSGAGNITENASGGVLILSGTNTYTGATNILAGTLNVTGNDALGSSGNNTSSISIASGAALQLSNVTIAPAIDLTLNGTGISSAGALIASGTSAYAGDITLNTDSSINSSGTLSLTGVIDGTGALTSQGTGTITLTNANTYTGATVISNGTLTITNAQGLGNTSAGTTVSNNGTLNLNVAGVNEAVTLNTGTLASAGIASLNGDITLATATSNIINANLGSTFSINGNINGGGNLTFQGAGTINFVGDIGNITRIGSLIANADTTITSSTVRTTNSQTYNNLIVLAANTLLDSLSDISFGSTIDGAFTLTVASGGTVTFSDAIGTTPLTGLSVTANTINLNGSSVSTTGDQIYTGNVVLGGATTLTANNAGTSNMTFTNGIGGNQNLTINTGATGTYQFNLTGALALNNINIAPGIGTTNNTLTLNTGGTQIWTITGANTGNLSGVTGVTGAFTFSNIPTLTGGSGNDNFVLAGGTLAGNINGSTGTNTLTGNNSVSMWTLSGTNGGTVTGITGNFSNIQNLTGGSADDTFILNDGAVITGLINGGSLASTNLINYTGYTSPITVYLSAINDGLAKDGSQTTVTNFSNINQINGDYANDTIDIQGNPFKVEYTANMEGVIGDPIYFFGFTVTGFPQPTPPPPPPTTTNVASIIQQPVSQENSTDPSSNNNSPTPPTVPSWVVTSDGTTQNLSDLLNQLTEDYGKSMGKVTINPMCISAS